MNSRNKINESPYKWQMAALNSWILNGHRGIIKAVTGSGKSKVGLMAIEYLRMIDDNTYFIITVPSKVLQLQWNDILTEKCNIPESEIQLHGGENTKKPDLSRKFHIFIINTASKVLPGYVREWRKHGKVLLLADECHKCGSPVNAQIFDAEYNFLLGLSATPERENDFGFENHIEPNIGNIVYNYDFAAALRDGVISEFKLTNIEVKLNSLERGEYDFTTKKISLLLDMIKSRYPSLRKQHKFFAALEQIQSANLAKHNARDEAIDQFRELLLKRKMLVNRAANRLDCIAYLVTRLSNSAKIIIFHELIDELGYIADFLAKNEIRHVIYHSEMNKSQKNSAIEAYRNDKSTVMLACRALDEGLDIPDTHIGIIAAASKSTRQRIQRIGRVLRKAPGKEYSWIFSLFAGNTAEESRYSKETEVDLFGAADIEYLNYSANFTL